MSDAANEQAAEPSWGIAKKRTVPLAFAPLVIARIDKANRRAEKLGCQPFTVTVSQPRLVEVVKPANDFSAKEMIEVVDIEINGAPVVLGGYRLLGRVDFEDGMVVVNSRPGEELPTIYRFTTPFCDHCASKRNRNAVFVFRRDHGTQHIQVGRSCLKDFLGHDPAYVLHSLTLWEDLCADLDSEEASFGGRAPTLVSVDAVLQMTAAVVRVTGGQFTSRGAADEYNRRSGRTMLPTSDHVSEQLFTPFPAPAGFVRVKVLQEDIDRADEAKAWAIEEMVGKADKSDYEYNMVELLGQEAVRARRIGMLCSLIGVYARKLGELVAKAKRVDAYVGAVGQRREFAATFAGQNAFETDYGTLYIGRFDTPEGLLVYRGSSPFWDTSSKPGEEFRFKATIKAHDDYKGTKQTMIQRVAIIKEAATA